MITTLPGLYLASVGLIQPVVWLADLTGKVVCSSAMLRFINTLFNCGNLYLLYLIVCKLHLKDKVPVNFLCARRFVDLWVFCFCSYLILYLIVIAYSGCTAL